MKKLSLPLLLSLLLTLSLCAAAQAQEILLDAADGPDLSARLQALSYTASDTLLLRGSFASLETVFPGKAQVELAPGAVIYGVLTFPQGGSLTGLYERDAEIPQVFGGVRADAPLAVGMLNIYGYLHLGDPEYSMGVPPEEKADTLRIEDQLHILAGGDTSALYSRGGILLTEGASVTVESAENGADVVVAENLRLQDRTMMDIRTDVPTWGELCLITDTIELGTYASLTASAGGDSCALWAHTTILGESADLTATSWSCYGVGLNTVVLKTGPDARIRTEAPHAGIVLRNFDEEEELFEEGEEEPVSDHIDLHPYTVLDANVLLFDGDFVFTEPLTFIYTTAEPPELCKELEEYSVSGYQEYYSPVVETPDEGLDDGDGNCCPPIPVEPRTWDWDFAA